MPDAKRIALIAIGLLGVTIVVLSLMFLYEASSLTADRFAPLKDAFNLAVSQVLLQMFTTVVAAALTYIFGKQLVSALSERIRAKAHTPNLGGSQ
jgi:ABC-type Na+ efflux pump permease subunit